MTVVLHLMLIGLGETDPAVLDALAASGLDDGPCRLDVSWPPPAGWTAALDRLGCDRRVDPAHADLEGIVLHGRGAHEPREAGPLVEQLRRRWPTAPVVVVHASGPVDAAPWLDLGVVDVVPAQPAHLRAALLLRSREALESHLRLRAEHGTRASQERFQRILDELEEGILLLDAAARVLFSNASGKRLLAPDGREIDLRRVGFSDEDGIYVGHDATPPGAVLRHGGMARGVLVVRGHAAGERWLDLRARALPPTYDGGAALVVVADVTQARLAGARQAELERQLHHTQRLHTLGEMAGGIAHDFNNILAPMQGYLDLVRARLEPRSPVAEDLGQIDVAVRRAQELVRQIATFGGHGEVRRRPVDVFEVATEALILLRASLPTTIEFRHRRGTGAVVVLADPTQVHQVVVNLCTNAGRAMGQGGVLTVHVDPVDVEGPLPGDGDDVAPGPYVRLRVMDTGCGMGQSTLERIFEPFFTTRSGGEGSGLGLSVVHGIVQQHAGAIRVQSVMQEGTTFDVYLPRTREGPGPEAAAERVAEVACVRGTERLLIVDDEPAIVDVLQRTMQRLGYAVDTAVSSPHALAKVRADPTGYAVLVTDFTMPRMTGLVLAGEARLLAPALRVILLTGYGGRLDPALLAAAGIDRLLLKPLEAERLARAVRELLRDGSAPAW